MSSLENGTHQAASSAVLDDFLQLAEHDGWLHYGVGMSKWNGAGQRSRRTKEGPGGEEGEEEDTIFDGRLVSSTIKQSRRGHGQLKFRLFNNSISSR